MKTIIYRGVRYEVSDWANFIATDESGEVWEYENKPKATSGVWGRNNAIEKQRLLAYTTDWKKSLQSIEECLAPEEPTKTAQSETDIAKLREFARTILYGSDKYGGAITEACDWDFDTLQEFAAELGIVEETKPTEPCGENCFCAANYDDDFFRGGTCYKPTTVLTEGSND